MAEDTIGQYLDRVAIVIADRITQLLLSKLENTNNIGRLADVVAERLVNYRLPSPPPRRNSKAKTKPRARKAR